jgi:tetratricopeptide (TPR) repeat protein
MFLSRKIKISFVVFITTMHCFSLSFAEKIYCKDTRVISGKITSHHGKIIWIESSEGSSEGAVGIDVEDIDRIENDDGSISKHDYKNLNKKALEHIQKEEYEKALVLYSRLLDNFSENLELIYIYALLNHRLSNYDEALRYYHILAQKGRADGSIYNNIAVIYALRKDYERAKEFFTKALNSGQREFKIRSNLAQLLLRNKEYKAALDEYSRILKIDPSQVKALYNLGVIYANIDEPGKAREYFKKAYELSKDDRQLKDALDYTDLRLNQKNGPDKSQVLKD